MLWAQFFDMVWGCPGAEAQGGWEGGLCGGVEWVMWRDVGSSRGYMRIIISCWNYFREASSLLCCWGVSIKGWTIDTSLYNAKQYPRLFTRTSNTLGDYASNESVSQTTSKNRSCRKHSNGYTASRWSVHTAWALTSITSKRGAATSIQKETVHYKQHTKASLYSSVRWWHIIH